MTDQEFERRYAVALKREEMCPPNLPTDWMSASAQLAHRVAAHFPDADTRMIGVILAATEAYWRVHAEVS